MSLDRELKFTTDFLSKVASILDTIENPDVTPDPEDDCPDCGLPMSECTCEKKGWRVHRAKERALDAAYSVGDALMMRGGMSSDSGGTWGEAQARRAQLEKEKEEYESERKRKKEQREYERQKRKEKRKESHVSVRDNIGSAADKPEASDGREVSSPEGVRRYKKPIGTPLGKSMEIDDTVFVDPETKVRRVRDPRYWGLPVNTIIKPGMKPVKPRAATSGSFSNSGGMSPAGVRRSQAAGKGPRKPRPKATWEDYDVTEDDIESAEYMSPEDMRVGDIFRVDDDPDLPRYMLDDPTKQELFRVTTPISKRRPSTERGREGQDVVLVSYETLDGDARYYDHEFEADHGDVLVVRPKNIVAPVADSASWVKPKRKPPTMAQARSGGYKVSKDEEGRIVMERDTKHSAGWAKITWSPGEDDYEWYVESGSTTTSDYDEQHFGSLYDAKQFVERIDKERARKIDESLASRSRSKKPKKPDAEGVVLTFPMGKGRAVSVRGDGPAIEGIPAPTVKGQYVTDGTTKVKIKTNADGSVNGPASVQTMNRSLTRAQAHADWMQELVDMYSTPDSKETAKERAERESMLSGYRTGLEEAEARRDAVFDLTTWFISQYGDDMQKAKVRRITGKDIGIDLEEKARYIRTPEGARKFGGKIGDLITLDMTNNTNTRMKRQAQARAAAKARARRIKPVVKKPAAPAFAENMAMYRTAMSHLQGTGANYTVERHPNGTHTIEVHAPGKDGPGEGPYEIFRYAEDGKLIRSSRSMKPTKKPAAPKMQRRKDGTTPAVRTGKMPTKAEMRKGGWTVTQDDGQGAGTMRLEKEFGDGFSATILITPTDEYGSSDHPYAEVIRYGEDVDNLDGADSLEHAKEFVRETIDNYDEDDEGDFAYAPDDYRRSLGATTPGLGGLYDMPKKKKPAAPKAPPRRKPTTVETLSPAQQRKYRTLTPTQKRRYIADIKRRANLAASHRRATARLPRGVKWDNISPETKAAVEAMEEAGTHEWIEDPAAAGVMGFVEVGTDNALLVVFPDGSTDGELA